LERLVTTSQAAEILGLSLQGIHYRIKKNQLKSLKKDGKTFVYISDEIKNENSETKTETSKTQQTNSNFEAIIEVKNEQIELLKKSMKWMKKQYISEIFRLEKNQKKIIEVFNSEIQLLQSAFNEMRSIYKPQLENSLKQQKNSSDFITVKDFSVLMKRYNKTEKEIKNIIFKAIENGDNRFIYNKVEKKLLILNSDFLDLV
jgi:HAMP domain-containing protein